jgi:hypothetical protein
MKLLPVSPASWTSVAPEASPARAAFAALDLAAGQLLEAALFDGCTCTELACMRGVATTEVRTSLANAMHALRAMLVAEPGEPVEGGAVAAMLALHALDTLDPDEAAVVDAMLAYQPALRRAHAGYCALVGELCLLVPPAEPPPCDVLRSLDATHEDRSDADTAVN